MSTPVPRTIVAARRVAGALLILSFLVVLVGCAFVINWWVTRPIPVAQAATGGASTSSQPTATATTTRSSPSASASTTSVKPSASSRFTCWNGEVKESLTGCPDPDTAGTTKDSLSALNSVFKNRASRLKDEGASCRNQKVLRNRVIHRICSLTYQGSPMCLHYSQWVHPEAAFEDYDLLGTPTRATRDDGTTLLTWGPAPTRFSCDGRRYDYKMAKLIEDQVWAVTAYSDSSDHVARAIAHFGEFRPYGEWRGVPR